MALRSWVIRGLILAGLGAVGVAGWVASSWVSPEAVKAQVLANLSEQLVDVDVSVGSARMRIFGGIAVTDLKLVRRGDPADKPFFAVPAAVLYHDKEQLNKGRLVIRKVELDNPEVHVERAADGAWNLLGLLRPSAPDKPIPTVVARGATLHVVDHFPGGLPPVTLTNARFTLLNDPLPVVTVQAQATCPQLGPVDIRARLHRVTNQLAVGLELPEVPVGEATAKAAARFAPDLAGPLAKLTARASVTADLSYTPDATPAVRHDVRVTVRGGRFEHPSLPWPLENIEATARVVDGRVKVDKATAQAGPATAELRVELRDAAGEVRTSASVPARPPAPSPASGDLMAAVEDCFQSAELTVRGVPLDEAVWARLPGAALKARRMFSPTGGLDVSYKLARDPAGWRRELEIRPKDLAVVYEKFRYPLSDVRGWVRKTVTQGGEDNTLIKLHGTAAGQPITIDGQLYGDGPDPAVTLRVAGNDLPLDDRLAAALPQHYPGVLRQFRAGGRGDFVAEIKQPLGVNLLENVFTVDLREGTVNYAHFPYPLEKVKGRLIIRTTATDEGRPVRPGEPVRPLPCRDEIVLQGFTAAHAGGTVWLHGNKVPVPDSADQKLTLHVGGNACPVDADLRAAVGALKLDGVWAAFAPTGVATFAADVEVIDRGGPSAQGSGVRGQGSEKPEPKGGQVVGVSALTPHPSPLTPPTPFNPATDLKLTFNFYGPSVTPAFFPYPMTDLSGWLEYKSGKLDLAHFAARHGDSRLKMAAGDVRFYPDGAAWANLGGVEVKPFVADAAFRAALPGKLRAAGDDMKLAGNAELLVKHLVVLTPPDRPNRPIPPPDPFPLAPGAVNGGPTPVPPLVRGQAPAPITVTDPDPVVYWDAELKLAGASAEVGMTWTDMVGGVGVRGRYEGTHLGVVRGNVWFDRASVAGQPVSRAQVNFTSDPQAPDPSRPGQFLPPEVEFKNLAGTLFHGTVGGEARVVLSEPAGYRVWLSATDVQLDEVARHYKLGSDADLKGVAQAQVEFFNRADPKTGRPTLDGTGRVDVPTGRMYNLPVLLDLVKVLKLQTPDKTAFEEAHAVFRLQGDRVKVDQLDLIGSAVSLGGSGEIDTRGDYVRFEFYTIWSKLLTRWLTTPVGDVTAFFSKSLFKVKMTRKDGKLSYEGELVPLVTDPAKAVLERLKARAGRLLGRPAKADQPPPVAPIQSASATEPGENSRVR